MITKQGFFKLAMFLLPIVVLIVAVRIINNTYYPVRSDYEKEIEKAGGVSISDLRTRAPYVMFRPKSVKNSIQINSLGFHSPEISIDKKTNEFRIAILGSSAAYKGAYSIVNGKLHDDKIIGILTEILKKNSPSLRGKDVKYINGAIPSAVAGQELAQFIWHIIPLKIDLLIVFDGFNDFWAPLNGYDPRIGYPYDYFVEKYRYYKFTSDKDYRSKKLVDYFKEPGTLVPTAVDVWERQQQKIVTDYFKELGIEKPPFPEVKPKILDAYFENVSKISTIANAYGIKSAIFLQPYSPIHNDTKRPEVRDLLDIYAMAGKRYKTLSEKNSATQIYWDFSSYMSHKMKPLFVDIVHFTDKGNEMIAEEMYSIMKKRGMVD